MADGEIPNVCHMKVTATAYSVLLMAALGILVPGCQQGSSVPGRATASGTVTFDGQPMKGGSITFKSKEPPEVQTTCLIINGKFECDRVPLGENVVTVETESLKYGNAAAYVKIPAKYNDPDTTDLTIVFQKGNNPNVNLELTSQ